MASQANTQAISAGRAVTSSGRYSEILLQTAIATMLIQTLVVSNVVKGLVLSYVLVLIYFARDMIFAFPQKGRLNVPLALLIFCLGFGAYQAFVQLLNLGLQPTLVDLPARVLVSAGNPQATVLRTSLFTQSAYLFVCVIFFLYILRRLIDTNGPGEALWLARWGVIIFVAFGFIEFAGYLLTGGSIDFISNRRVGDNYSFGLFQTIQLGGVVIQRMKSLAGEPSMFAFSIMPFAIIFYYLRDKIFWLLLVALLLSTSTTAVLGLLIFALIEVIRFKKLLRFGLVALAIGAILLVIGPQTLTAFYQITLSKLSLENASGIGRFENFLSAFALFANSNVLHLIFGHGFGYIRSTDGFTTLLVDVGVIGFSTFTAFVFYPLFRIKYNNDYKRGLLAANIVLYALIMISVPEFYCFHIWFFAALGWYEYLKISSEREYLHPPAINESLTMAAKPD